MTNDSKLRDRAWGIYLPAFVFAIFLPGFAAAETIDCSATPAAKMTCPKVGELDCQKPPQPRPSCAAAHSLDNSAAGLAGLVNKGEAWRTGGPAHLDRMKAQSGGINHLTIHYTGVKQNSGKSIEQKLQGLYRFSANMYECEPDFRKARLWGDIPYNFYIDMLGNVAKARDVNCQDDTNTDYNPDGHVTIVVEGTLNDTFSDNVVGKLYALMRAVQAKYSIPISAVGVHNDYTKNTDCPGPEVKRLVQIYIANFRKECAGGKLSGALCR